MQIRICADVTCKCRNAGDADRRLNRRAAVVAVVASERRRMRTQRGGKCLPFCSALKGHIVPAVPLRLPASKPSLGRRLH